MPRCLSQGQPPLDVQLLEFVETCEDTSASNTSQNVSACSLHQRHKSFVLHDLNEAINGAIVLNGLARRHHHTSTDGIDWIRNKTRCNCHTIAKSECKSKAGIVAQQYWLKSIIEAKVATTIDDILDHTSTELESVKNDLIMIATQTRNELLENINDGKIFYSESLSNKVIKGLPKKSPKKSYKKG